MTAGRFITFEGADGVGKTTQISLLAERLGAAGQRCLVTREPGGTPFAERLRSLILDPDTPEHAPLAEALLFAAARQDHVARVIGPALAAATWVLCDRFADSTRAYQGAAGGVDGATLRQVEGIAHPGCQPDLTIVLDLPPELGRARLKARNDVAASPTAGPAGGSAAIAPEAVPAGGAPDRFERRDDAFQSRLRNAFLEIAAKEPERCAVVDASRSPEAVHAAIWALLTARLRSGSGPDGGQAMGAG